MLATNKQHTSKKKSAFNSHHPCGSRVIHGCSHLHYSSWSARALAAEEKCIVPDKLQEGIGKEDEEEEASAHTDEPEESFPKAAEPLALPASQLSMAFSL